MPDGVTVQYPVVPALAPVADENGNSVPVPAVVNPGTVPQDYLRESLTPIPQDYLRESLTPIPRDYLQDRLTELPNKPVTPAVAEEPVTVTDATAPPVVNPATAFDPRSERADLSNMPTALTPPTAAPPNGYTTNANGIAVPMTRREQIAQQIGDLQNKKIDEHRGFGNTLKSMGISFLQRFGEAEGMPLGQRLIYALGGAAGGGVVGTVDPNFAAKQMQQIKLHNLYRQYGQAAEMDKMNAGVQKAQAEAQGAGADAISKNVSDYLKVAMADNNIDEGEAATLRRLTGKPYTASDWRKVVRYDKDGVPFLSREGEEASRVDTSLPIDTSAVPKQRTIPGQGTFTVPDKTAFPAAATIANANAQRAQSETQFETTQQRLIDQYNLDKEGKYQGDQRSFDNDQLKAKAAIAKNTPVSTANAATVAALDAQIKQQAAQGYDTSDLQKQRNDAENKRAEAQGEIDAANTMLQAKPPEKPGELPKHPGKSGKGSKGGKNNNIGTQDDYQKALRRIAGGG